MSSEIAVDPLSGRIPRERLGADIRNGVADQRQWQIDGHGAAESSLSGTFWSEQAGHVGNRAGDVLLADRFVYERKANGAWRPTAMLLPTDAPALDEFPGESALSSRGVAVLTAFEFIGQDFPTAAYVYKRRSRGSWKRIATLSPAEKGARFFGRVDTDGRGVIAGGITAQGERVAYIFEVPHGAGKSKREHDQSLLKNTRWSD